MAKSGATARSSQFAPPKSPTTHTHASINSIYTNFQRNVVDSTYSRNSVSWRSFAGVNSKINTKQVCDGLRGAGSGNQGATLLASTCISRAANAKYIRGRKSNTAAHQPPTALATSDAYTATATTIILATKTQLQQQAQQWWKKEQQAKLQKKTFVHCGRCCGFCKLATAGGIKADCTEKIFNRI